MKKLSLLGIFAIVLFFFIAVAFLMSPFIYQNRVSGLSLYPIIAAFLCVIQLQIASVATMSYLCHAEKSYLLPFVLMFGLSGLFFILAIKLWFVFQFLPEAFFANVSDLYLLRNIVIGIFFGAILYLYYKKEAVSNARLLAGIMAGGLGLSILIMALYLIVPQAFSERFAMMKRSAPSLPFYVLAPLWLGAAIGLLMRIELRSFFWFSMFITAVSNLLSLAATYLLWPVYPGGWYVSRATESIGIMLIMIALMSDIFSRYQNSCRAYAQSYENSVRDPMTGLYHRGYFYEQLSRIVAWASPGQPVSLIFCDLDHFKNINDTYGHLQGDRVIIHLAQMMMNTVRQHDIVARIGGEEFAIILQNTDMHKATIIAERLRRHVEIATPESTGNDFPKKITLSLGIASTRENTLLANELAHMADSALYTAKRQGRNRVAVYHHNLIF
ncbi:MULTISPECIES: GGDEF domain-containing protein [unclassified Klebsiella]|uniref:sensor domain-containing diguanylate cyclase n=1 Tax=unclassified Klebsiella TaxID=2608929 RepID=UPI0015DC98E6|nr:MULTISPECIES: sensor domain-containing diguanylate cyclase [unclassified Klebsiella]BBQ85151.1 GGDEF domain-containing protein [Klebsiella sp. WP3-W18-ESBL-02]BBR22204.1 GGDEF domain-containing protein [Klebsiella sp. WP3-S18-ESBL-05]